MSTELVNIEDSKDLMTDIKKSLMAHWMGSDFLVKKIWKLMESKTFTNSWIEYDDNKIILEAVKLVLKLQHNMLTLGEIKNTFIDKVQCEAIKAFIWAMICDRWLLQSKSKLFYNPTDKISEDIFRVIDESYFKKYKHTTYKLLQFEPDRWVIKEFFNNKVFTLELPVWTWKDITESFLQNFLSLMAKERIIDDLLYTIIKNICRILGIYYNEELGVVTFWEGQKKTRIKSWNIYTNVKVKDISLEDVVNAEINQGYVNKDIWDKDREFAYAHLLRAHASFKLFDWAKKILINWKKYNIVAASRWQWKTYIAAFLSARELLKPWKWFGGRPYREIKYFVPNKEDIGNQVMQYIESLLWDLVDKKINGKPLFDIQRSKHFIRCNLTWNTFKIVSLHNMWRNNWDLGSAIWEGIACDFAIVDEACRIIDSFWASFHQRAAFETDSFFVISTINEETPVDHWFYKLLVDWETGTKDIASYRITIDDNEVMKQWKTEEEWFYILEKAKEALRIKWDKEFYSKWYCIILEESNVFNTWTYIVPYSPNKHSDSDARILWFDLGKLTDTCWLVLINLKTREIEEARLVINATYGTQLQYAKDYKKKYKNLLIIWDRSWVGESVSEQDLDVVVDTWIKSTGVWELSYNKKYWYYTCNKGLIINTFATVMNTNLLKISSDLVDLVNQMNSFVKIKSGRWEVILYKWKGRNKDDLVLSCAYAIVYMYLILWLKSIKDIEDYTKEIWNMWTYVYNDKEDNNNLYYNWLY